TSSIHKPSRGRKPRDRLPAPSLSAKAFQTAPRRARIHSNGRSPPPALWYLSIAGESMQNLFMGGDRWGPRLRPSLGQGLTNGDAVRILKDSVDRQQANRERNDGLPEAFQLDQENDILPVDQALDDQTSWINKFNADKGQGWYWEQPAEKGLMNSALSVQALVAALERRILNQQDKAPAAPPVRPPAASVPTTPAVKLPLPSSKGSGTVVLVGIAAAAFVGAVFLSREQWSGLPWSSSPHEPFLSK